MNRRQMLITWLNDALAMERALIPILENHASDAKAQPEVRRRVRQHAEETRQQADRLEAAIRQLGEKPSAVKKSIGAALGAIQAPATGLTHDELVKNALLDYATEHFEIACYRALVTAAEEIGEAQIAAVCRDILAQEEQMAAWLAAQLPEVVQHHLRTHHPD